MDKIEIRQKKLEYLAGTKFDNEEWAWYNENKNNLNAKAQARWNEAWKLAEAKLSELEKIDALYEHIKHEDGCIFQELKPEDCPACYSGKVSTPAKPKIVCLCGSTKFSEAFRTAQFNETMAGKIVLTIGCNMKSDDDLFGNMAEPLKESIKHQLDELHLRKIEMADEVLILNIGSYIGESTRRELEYARKLRKVIRFAEPVGAPNIRDPEGICDGFEPIGTVYGKDCQGDCETDGHYMCAQCVHREPFKSLEEQDEREQV